MASLQLFDSSVMIPWLRDRRHDASVTAAFESRRFLLCTVVWMELYAGTRSRADKRDLDEMVKALSAVHRIASPEPEDFYTAGQMVSYYGRQYGVLRIRDHTHDILAALCASRADAELMTINRGDMERWQRILRRMRRRLKVTVIEGET